MQDEYGTIIIQAPIEFSTRFKNIDKHHLEINEIINDLIKLLGVELDEYDNYAFSINDIKILENDNECFIKLDLFQTEDWLDATRFVLKNKSKNKLAWFARISDEYFSTLFAATKEGKCYEFKYSHGGEEYQDEKFTRDVQKNITKWHAILSIPVKTMFIDFSDIKSIELEPDC